MQIQKNIALVEEILDYWRLAIGPDMRGYKNHVYRMIHCCFVLHDASEDEQRKIIIAGCFHDMGLFTEKTVDYLLPSVLLARDYLNQNDLADWATEIELMIDLHHKILPYKGKDYPLVEIFRRADLADFSLGMIRGGVPRETMNRIKAAFPNAGFHKMLMKVQGRWLLRHPWNPFPILKW